jgi:hypothetical protein
VAKVVVSEGDDFVVESVSRAYGGRRTEVFRVSGTTSLATILGRQALGAGTSLVDGGAAVTVASPAALRALRPRAADDLVWMSGYASPGDGGQGYWQWDASNVSADNTGAIIKVDNVTTGRWKRWRTALNIQTFGAMGLVDDTAFIQNCINQANNGQGVVELPAGVFIVKDTIVVANHGIHIRGQGPLQTTIYFDPASAKSCFQFKKAGGIAESACSIEGVSFTSPNNAIQKTAIEYYDVSELRCRDIRVQFSGVGSRAFWVRGREFLWISECQVSAPTAVQISSNPDNPTDCFDQSSIVNCYFIGTSVDYNIIEIDDGVTIGPTLIQNVHLNGGKNGLHWEDTSSAARSDILRVQGFRYEQTAIAVTGGWAIYLKKSGAAQGGKVHVEDFSGGNAGDYNGMHIEGFGHTLVTCEFQGNGSVVGLEFTGSGIHIDCQMSLSGAQCLHPSSLESFSVPMAAGNCPRFVCWDIVGQPQQFRTLVMFGQQVQWFSAPPTSGTWKQGDICWNTGATAGWIAGWLCTSPGTPGAWSPIILDTYTQTDTTTAANADVGVHLLPSNSACVLEFTTTARRTGGARGTGAVGDTAVFIWQAVVKMAGNQGSVDPVVIGAKLLSDASYIDADLVTAGINVTAPQSIVGAHGYVKVVGTAGAASINLRWYTTIKVKALNT